MFDSIATLAVAQNMRDLYRLVLVDTPLAPYFSGRVGWHLAGWQLASLLGAGSTADGAEALTGRKGARGQVVCRCCGATGALPALKVAWLQGAKALLAGSGCGGPMAHQPTCLPWLAPMPTSPVHSAACRPSAILS
jgi:hypothetical protein